MSTIDIAASEEVRADEILVCDAAGTSVLLTRVDGAVYAVENRCPHLGLSFARGKIKDSVLVCPWHGSKFDIKTGENLDWVNSVAGMPAPKWTHSLIALGKKPAPIRTLEVSESNGRININL